MSSSLQDSPYRRVLKNVSLSQALDYVARCSVKAWQSEQQGPLHQHSETIRGIARVSKPYALTTLAYLAGEIIANAQGVKEFGLDEFNAGVEFINSPSEIERDFKYCWQRPIPRSPLQMGREP